LSLIGFQVSSLYLLLFDACYLSTAISVLFGEGETLMDNFQNTAFVKLIVFYLFPGNGS